MSNIHYTAMAGLAAGGPYIIFFVLPAIVAVIGFVCWAGRSTSKMTPEDAVNHEERVDTVMKGLAVANVGLAVANQVVKHAGPKPSHFEIGDVLVPAVGLGSYALHRHSRRREDIAAGVNPDLPRDQLHAARVAAKQARVVDYPQGRS